MKRTARAVWLRGGTLSTHSIHGEPAAYGRARDAAFKGCALTPADILPSLVELSIAIAGFSGIAVAVQERSERSSNSAIFLSSLLLSTFVASVLSVAAMVLLTAPLAPSVAWSVISFVHAAAAVGILVVRAKQRTRGDFVRTRPLKVARASLYGVAGFQLSNAIVFHEPWLSVLGLAAYSFFGFGFFVSLLHELVRPNAA